MAEGKPALSAMTVDLLVGDSVQIGDVTLEMQRKTGRYARLVIRAPRHVPIKRHHADDIKPVPSMAECVPD